MSEFTFTPFPVLITERFNLRELSLNDAEEVFIQRSHPVILKYIKKAPAVNIEEAIAFIQRVLCHQKNNESIMWAIVPKGEKKLIGTICLWNIEKELDRAEVGYNLHPDYFGKGIMSEALSKVVSYGFEEMKLERIDAYTNKNNKDSLKLLKKNKFVRNFVFENEFEDKEELEYNVIYTLNKTW